MGNHTFLQAIISFLSGEKLNSGDYYHDAQDVAIAIRFDNVKDEDLEILETGTSHESPGYHSRRVTHPSKKISTSSQGHLTL